MRSVKPGRGPSAMGAVGSCVAILFGIFWTVMAYQLTRDAPFPLVGVFFPLFGAVFVLVGIGNLIYHLYNTTAPNRLSTFDLTEHGEEPDPLNRRFGGRGAARKEGRPAPRRHAGDFCPFCGEKVGREVDFCPRCGKDI